jgi:hypothetical protein
MTPAEQAVNPSTTTESWARKHPRGCFPAPRLQRINQKEWRSPEGSKSQGRRPGKVIAMNIIEQLEKEQAAALSKKRKIPEFAPGDTLRVNVKVVEGERTRVQA